jgi:hypothetical protein
MAQQFMRNTKGFIPGQTQAAWSTPVVPLDITTGHASSQVHLNLNRRVCLKISIPDQIRPNMSI